MKSINDGKMNLALIDNPERAPLTPELKEKIMEISRLTGILPSGLTVLGGRIYVNVSGLDGKIQEAEKNGKFKIKSIDTVHLQHPTEENGYLAGYKAIIDLQDNPVREKLRAETIQSLALGNPQKTYSAEEIKKILELSGLLPPRFTDEGWCSPDTAQAIAWKYEYNPASGKKEPTKVLIENIRMMAIRKATNRAKRQLIGCGITSLEEVAYTQNATVTPPTESSNEKSKPEAKVDGLFKSEKK
jgi:hypothetical protein